MRQISRSTWILALLLLLPLAAAAETFTITLDNGSTFLTRYQPTLSMPDETRVILLTETGNWISIPRDRVVGLSNSTESRGFGRVIDTTTISLGPAPNENEMVEGDSAADPATRLLQYMTQRDAASQRDYSVDQFVDTEDAGQGGFPSTYGSEFSSRPRGGGPSPAVFTVGGSGDDQ